MKIINIILLWCLAAVLVALTAVFVLFQTFDGQKYLSQASAKASSALGRPVTVGGMGLGLSWQGLSLDVGPLTAADDPAFTSQPFMEVGRLRFFLDLGKLLFNRQLRVTRVLLESPEIHFIRSREGNFNAATLKRPNTSVLEGHKTTAASPQVVPSSSQPMAAQHEKDPERLMFDTALITIHDASVSYIDQNRKMPLNIWLSGIDTTIDSRRPFPLSLQASLRILDNDVLKDISGRVQLAISALDTTGPGSLQADGEIIIDGGMLKDVNVINMVLSHALGNFRITGANFSNLLAGPLSSRDTVLKNVRAQFSVQDQTLSLKDALIQTDLVEFQAHGTINRQMNVDMQTVLHLNSGATSALVGQFSGLKVLCDASGRITINAGLTGPIRHLKYKPDKDFRKKSRRALMQEGANILGALLGR